MGVFTIIITLLFIIALGYIFLVTTGYDNFRGITLQLDDMYINMNEMLCAVLEELVKQKRECEVIETGEGYPKLLVDGKKYLMTYKMISMSGIPMQVVQLKRINKI